MGEGEYGRWRWRRQVEGGPSKTGQSILGITYTEHHHQQQFKMSPEIPKKMKALRVNSGNQYAYHFTFSNQD